MATPNEDTASEQDTDGLPGAPTTPAANRAAQQGSGMGAREIDAQQDPRRNDSRETTGG